MIDWLRRKRHWLPTLILLLVLAAGEGALRLADYRKPWEYSEGSFYSWDPELFWRLKPGAMYVWDGVGIHVTSQGFRGQERPGLLEGDLRIVCLGDSVAFGFGVPGELTYSSHLEHLLRQRGIQAEVVNAGVPGYSSVQIFRYFKELAESEPDVAVFAVGGVNDGSPTFMGRADLERPTGWKARAVHVLERSSLFVWLYRLTHETETGMDISEMRTSEDLIQALRRWNEGERRASPEEYAEQVDKMIELAEAEGIRLVFLAVPVNPYSNPGPPETEEWLEAPDDVRLSMEILSQRDTADAEVILRGVRDLIQRHPSTAYLWYEAGRLYHGMGQFQKAAEAFARAYDLSPRRFRVKEYQDRAKALAAERGIAFVDVTPRFEAEWFQPGKDDTRLFLDFCHPSGVGHLIIAEALAESIVSTPAEEEKTESHGG